MHVRYGHDYTVVLRLDMPIPETAKNAKAYSARGWCVFELRVSSMKSELSRTASHSNTDIAMVPIGPEDFSKDLEQLHFTNGF